DVSYNEILNISNLLNRDLKSKIYKFSNNEAVEKIIKIANKNEKTYILAIGGLTNISCAINKNPGIIGKIDVIWLGGNSLKYGNNKEFNFMQDTKAVQDVVNSNVKITIIPARNVATELMINISELESKLDMNNELSKYLCNRFQNDSFYGVKQERVIWDISVVAYLRNKNWFKTEENLKLYVTPELNYIINNEKQSNNINIVKYMDRDEIYNDLFNQLNK
ncbi:MAG: nucleoside hydrolase, partial [Clostridia bacterium]|nr:nucleoside hydrolase [Clostridia bacterium]